MDTSLNLGGDPPKPTKAKEARKPKASPPPKLTLSETETAKAAKAALGRISSGYSQQDALKIEHYIVMLEAEADG
jgi:hypothetical protein